MKSFKSQLALLSVLLVAGSVASMFAQNTTVLKIQTQSALAVPGNVLEPGTYVFRMPDSATGYTNVQILSADGKTKLGFIPIYSARRSRTTGVSTMVAVPGQSGLLRVDSWFLPGSQDGFRFIYGRSDLRKIETIAQQMPGTKGMSAGN